MTGETYQPSPASTNGRLPTVAVPNRGVVCEELRRTVAIAIREARSHAEVIELAQQYAEPIAPSDEPVLSCEEFDRLLDPLTPTEERFRLFQRFLHDTVAFERIDGVTPAHLADDAWVQHLFDETLSWGEAGRLFLADESLWQLTINGATARLSDYGSEVIHPTSYANSRVPLSRAEFLVLATGGSWNRQTPLTTITFRSGTRVKLAREPLVRACVPGQPGFLCTVQRGKNTRWTLKNLIAQQVLDGPTAALLTALLHARCSLLVSGPPGVGKAALLEALLQTVPTDQSLFVLESPSGVKHMRDAKRPHDVNLEKEVLPEKLGAFLATFGPGLVADRFVAAVTDPSSADVALTMLTVGVPVLLSIDAVTPSASFDRLFHLLSGPNLGMYQGSLGTGLEREHLLQVHVQLAQPGWGSLGYVSAVHVLADVAKQSGPALVQVATANTTRSRRTWTHSARIEDGDLRFESPDYTPPTSLRLHLADVPEEIWEQWRSEPLKRPTTRSHDPALRPYCQLLRDARALFEARDFAAAAERLESAAAMNTDRSLEDLADDLLASDVCQLLDQHVAETAAAITAALDAGKGEQAAALLEAPTNVLVARARTRSQPWQTLALRLGVMRAAFGTCQERLQEVREAEEQGDLRRAYAIATSIRTAFLLPELQRKLLLLRQSQLQSLLAQLDKTAAAENTYRAALAQIERDFIALQPHESYANATASQQTISRMPVLADSPDPITPPPSPQAMEKASGAPGWLDAALARNRERRHHQPGEQEARGE